MLKPIASSKYRAALYLTAIYWYLIAHIHTASAQLALREQDFFSHDIPIVLSASRLKQNPQSAPAALTVIDRKMIEASGFTEIPDLLRLVPGFFIEYDSGHIQAAGYHLLENRYVRQQQVLIDGRSVYTPSWGGVPWSDLAITIDDIERIEVVRGPNAVTYGSNSFLGVINIITRHASLDKGTSLKGHLGSQQRREAFLRYGGGSDSLDYRINLAYRADDGFDERADSRIIRMANSRIDYQINNYNNFSLQAGYSEGPREEDNPLDTSVPYHVKSTISQYQQARWEHRKTSHESTHLQVYHNLIQENKTYTRTDLPLTFNEGTVAERYDIEYQKTNKADEKWRYAYGFSYRKDRVNSELFLGTNNAHYSRYRRLFGEVEHAMTPRHLFNVGLMIEDNDIVGTEYSPRIAYNFHATENDTIRLSFSRATRTPVIFEKSPDYRINTPVYNQFFIANPDIRSERITAYDIGFVGKIIDLNLRYDIRLFYEDIHGLIGYATQTPFPDFDNEVSKFGNFDDALIRGVEVQLDWNVTSANRIHFGFAHIEIDSENRRGEYSIAAPVNSISALLMHDYDHRTTASIGIYHRSRMNPLDRKSSDPILMPPHTRVDLRLARSFQTSGLQHHIAFVVQNIFDSEYFARLGNVIDRRSYLSYKINF